MKKSINFRKNYLSFIFLITFVVLMLWNLTISWVGVMPEIINPCELKSQLTFSTYKFTEFNESILMSNQGFCGENIGDFNVFTSKPQLINFVSKCFSEFKSSFIKLFSPVSAYAEDMGKECDDCTTNEAQAEPNDSIHDDDLQCLIALLLGTIAGLVVTYKFYTAIDAWRNM